MAFTRERKDLNQVRAMNDVERNSMGRRVMRDVVAKNFLPRMSWGNGSCKGDNKVKCDVIYTDITFTEFIINRKNMTTVVTA